MFNPISTQIATLIWPDRILILRAKDFKSGFALAEKTYIIPDLDQMLKGSLAEHPAPIWQARACQICFAL